MRHIALALPILAIASPAAAQQALPEPVRAMIEAAIATGDQTKVATVVDIARQTNPDAAAEIAELKSAFDAEQAEIARQAAEAEKLAMEEAGLFDNWSGKGEVGAFRSTGNSSNTGLTGALKLKREGIDWSHEIRLRADYQRSNGVTTREQFLAAYEPRYDIDDGFFAYGLAQYDRDRFQGFDARYVLSGGVGYTVLDSDSATLAIKAGPAYRRTDFTNGQSADSLAGLVGLDFDWRIADRVTFTQDANAVSTAAGGAATLIVDSASTSLSFVSGLQFKVSDKVSTRFSYQVDYESDPPPGAVSTDTLSRFTLIYGF